MCALPYQAFADLSEDNASAAALAGITSLSDSPSSLTLSPLVWGNGTVFGYHLPFGDSQSQVWGFHTGSDVPLGHAGFGVNWLNHPHYQHRDYYVCYALGDESLALGYTQHLVWEGFSTGEAYLGWQSDMALGGSYNEYGAEFRWLRIGKGDAQIHISAIYQPYEHTKIASAYVYQPRGRDSFRSACTVEVAKMMTILSSWQSEPSRFGIGIRLNPGAGNITYAIRTHPELALSHFKEVGFSW